MPDDARASLAKRIYDTAHITGDFTLRSGAKSTSTSTSTSSKPTRKLLKDIAEAIVPLVPPGIDALAGLEMGGIPIATMLSQLTGLPVLFVRKKAKDYGTCKIAEGGRVRGRKLLIVEDVVTSGGAILDAAKALRAEGAELAAVVCVIDRESGGPANLAKSDLILTPLFTMSELKNGIPSAIPSFRVGAFFSSRSPRHGQDPLDSASISGGPPG
jgi:orotate phosphoribosyltransferase